MPVITAIKPQKNGKRVNIYLDGRFGFGLDLENFTKLGLKVEKQLTESEIVDIVNKGEFSVTLDKLLRFAMVRPRSEKEITDWFRRKKIREKLHNRLIQKLKGFKLLDDEKFASWWVEQRKQFKYKSKRELVYELRNKGIGKEIISKVLTESGIDDGRMARELLRKKKYIWEKLDNTTARRKMSEYLLRKGYDWELVKSILDEFVD